MNFKAYRQKGAAMTSPVDGSQGPERHNGWIYTDRNKSFKEVSLFFSSSLFTDLLTNNDSLETIKCRRNQMSYLNINICINPATEWKSYITDCKANQKVLLISFFIIIGFSPIIVVFILHLYTVYKLMYIPSVVFNIILSLYLRLCSFVCAGKK